MSVLGIALADWITIIQGVLAFPKSVLQVIQTFQKTPEEKHQELVNAIQAESAKYQETGRPTWN